MNELVNFARQALERRADQDGKAESSVPSRSIDVFGPDWLSRWRELAGVTDGLLLDDPRLGPVLSALAVCEGHYKAADLDRFTKSVERVRRLMLFTPGAKVRWEGDVNHRLRTLGPAMVEHVHHDQGRLWIWVSWRGTGRWVCESIITKIEGPTL